MRNRWSKITYSRCFKFTSVDYPSPTNLGYLWGVGSCRFVSWYSNSNRNFPCYALRRHVDLAFASVEHIMRDVNNGWLVRYIHANGASMFLLQFTSICLRTYIMGHMHTHAALWCSGVIIF